MSSERNYKSTRKKDLLELYVEELINLFYLSIFISSVPFIAFFMYLQYFYF